MPDTKEKHPNWFKLKLERRDMVRQLAPETAVNVLLACWEYLETGEKSAAMSPIENIVFAAFMPDLEEAWSRYIARTANGAKGGRPKRKSIPDAAENHMVPKKPYGTEEETETEPETEIEEDTKKVVIEAATPPLRACPRVGTSKRPRFVAPTLEEVTAYVRERGSKVDPQGFIDFYEANGWKVGKNKMKDWKAACRNAECWERWDKAAAGNRIPDYPCRSGNPFADLARKEGLL